MLVDIPPLQCTYDEIPDPNGSVTPSPKGMFKRMEKRIGKSFVRADQVVEGSSPQPLCIDELEELIRNMDSPEFSQTMPSVNLSAIHRTTDINPKHPERIANLPDVTTLRRLFESFYTH